MHPRRSRDDAQEAGRDRAEDVVASPARVVKSPRTTLRRSVGGLTELTAQRAFQFVGRRTPGGFLHYHPVAARHHVEQRSGRHPHRPPPLKVEDHRQAPGEEAVCPRALDRAPVASDPHPVPGPDHHSPPASLITHGGDQPPNPDEATAQPIPSCRARACATSPIDPTVPPRSRAPARTPPPAQASAAQAIWPMRRAPRRGARTGAKRNASRRQHPPRRRVLQRWSATPRGRVRHAPQAPRAPIRRASCAVPRGPSRRSADAQTTASLPFRRLDPG